MPGNRGRRQVLAILGAGLFVWVANRLLNLPRRLDYAPVPGAPGFRIARAGGTSVPAFDPFIGLDAPKPAPPEIGPGAVCDTLFRVQRPGTVPVASFSDYFCPYCRVLTPELATRHDAGAITVTWHELPLLGAASEAAARVALAADRQGAYPEMQARLIRTRVVADPAFIADLGRSLGLDGARLAADAQGRWVQDRIDAARGLADVFGFFGTPAVVVGRTAVLGSVPLRTLDRLIAEEAGNVPPCE